MKRPRAENEKRISIKCCQKRRESEKNIKHQRMKPRRVEVARAQPETLIRAPIEEATQANSKEAADGKELQVVGQPQKRKSTG
jgi:hypothetical protein